MVTCFVNYLLCIWILACRILFGMIAYLVLMWVFHTEEKTVKKCYRNLKKTHEMVENQKLDLTRL